MDLPWLHVRNLLPACSSEMNLISMFLQIFSLELCRIQTGGSCWFISFYGDTRVASQGHVAIGTLLMTRNDPRRGTTQKWVKWHNPSSPENYRDAVTFIGSEVLFLGRSTQLSTFFFCSSGLHCISMTSVTCYTNSFVVSGKSFCTCRRFYKLRTYSKYMKYK